MGSAEDRQQFFIRIAVIMGACTLLLTFSFVGVLAIISGNLGDASGRLPWYLVIAALAFVAVIVILEVYGATGREIIISAIMTGVWGFIVTALSIEGVLYAVSHPEEVFTSQLVLYFLAAAMLGTGIAYWALHHWREFTEDSSRRL